MKTRIVPITNKSTAPRALVNALLGPFLRAKTTGFRSSDLNFLTDVEHDNQLAVDAPVGYVPRRGDYSRIIPTLHDLDPTSELALSTRMFFEEDKTASIARTSTLREKVYNYGLSAVFGEWWKSYSTLAGMALRVQNAKRQGTLKQLDSALNIKEGDGVIEAFLLATGELTDSTIGMSEFDDVDVELIISTVGLQLKEVIDAISQDGFEAGIASVNNVVGLGVHPTDKNEIALIKAEMFEKLFCGNIKKVLRHKHARALLRDVITSRIPSNLCGIGHDFIIQQGHDTLLIPGDIMQSATTPSGVFDAMCALVDDRGQLTTDSYLETSFSFVNQFFTTGDLVRALFVDETVDPLTESQLCVFVAPPVDAIIQGVTGNGVSEYIPGTGGLGSLQDVSVGRINWLCGMQQHYADMSNSTGTALGNNDYDKNMMFTLPNGLLDMTSPANISAIDWYHFLSWYRRTRSPELERVLNVGGSSATMVKKDLKLAKISLANSMAAFSKLNYDSQRDGVMQPCSASFNLNKYNRLEQQGPVLVDLSPHVGPMLTGAVNGWNRTEDRHHINRRTLAGNSPEVNHDYPSIFVGEPQGGKTPSPFIPAGLPSEELMGTANHELEVAYNLMSLPLDLAGNAALSSICEPAAFPVNFGGAANQRAEVKKNQYWNLEPLQGFKRGFFLGRSETTSDPSNSSIALADWKRTAAAGFTGVVVNGTTVGILAPSGVVNNADIHAQIETMKAGSYHLQPYSGYDSGISVMRSAWFWDPSQTTALGNTNFVIYGEYCNSLCFSAGHATHPVVAVGAIKTRDLNEEYPTTRRTMSSSLHLSEFALTDLGLGIAPVEMHSPHTHTREVALLDSRIEQEVDAYPGVVVSNLWFDSADVISEEFAEDYQNRIGGVTVLNQVYTHTSPGSGVYADTEDMTPRRLLISTTNPYATGINSVVANGMNSTDKSFTGAIQFGNPLNLDTTPKIFDGPSVVPCNGKINALVVYGVGFSMPDERTAFAFSNLYAAISRTTDLTDETSPAMYPGAAFADVRSSWADVRSAAIAGNLAQSAAVFPDCPNIAADTTLGSQLSNFPGFKAIREPWFLSSSVRIPKQVPRYLSELRGSSLQGAKNPWMKPSSSESGWMVQSYSAPRASSLIPGAIRDAMVSKGSDVLKGMSNSDWRDLYIFS